MVVGRIAHGDPPAVAVDAQVNAVPTADRQVTVDVAALGDVADIGVASVRTRAQNLEAPGGGRQKAQQQPQQGGFPTAVRAQHGHELSGVHREAGISPDQLVSVGGSHAIGEDGGSDRTGHLAAIVGPARPAANSAA